MRYCATAQRQAVGSAADPAHLSPSRGDTLPAPARPPPPLDWPDACGGAPGGAAAAALSGLAATWSVVAARDGAAAGRPAAAGGGGALVQVRGFQSGAAASMGSP